MDVRVLRYFLTVANEENITRAAELLHITQPTLSRQLSALEKEEGVRLFTRSSRKVTLTREGLILKRRAEQILDLVDKASEEIRGQEGDLTGKLMIGAGELKSLETLSRICGTFHELHPGVKFGIHTADANVVRDNILRGDYDIGLLLEPVDLTPFEYIRMPDKVHANGGVIIATGGYAANAEMVEQYNGVSGLPTSNAPTSTGDGIKLGLAAGAALEGMDYIQIHPHGNPTTGGLTF